MVMVKMCSVHNVAVVLFLLTIHLCCQTVYGIDHYCSDVNSLRTALDNVVPGDVIILASGTTFLATNVGTSGTGAHFSSTVDGTSETNRITIRSENPNNPAILSGSQTANLSVLRIYGNYWTIRDIKVTNAQKGIVLDNAHHGQILNCEVYNVGYEAIHALNGADDALIQGCFVHDTGLVKPGFGEAIYIGSDKGAWNEYAKDVDRTVVRNCTIGPNVTAEAFDIKEGTSETIIEYNTVDATGISSANFADSFIDLKGTRTYVRYNTFYRNGEANLEKGIAVIDRSVPLSSFEHTIHDNVFYLDDTDSIPMVEAYSGTSDVYVFNNLPLDGTVSNSIITECCPSWYTPPPNGTVVCLPPVGHYSSEITNTSALLAWTGYANQFTIRYKEIGSTQWIETATVVDNELQLSSLTFNATYEWQVQSNCVSSNSTFSGQDTFTTSVTSSGPPGGPPAPPGSEFVYVDALGSGWNDYSYGGTYNLAFTSEVKYGTNSIECRYSSYGGLNLKRSNGDAVDVTDLGSIRFWVKGDSSTNGSGDSLIRLEIDGAQYEFFVLNDGNWIQYTIPLEEFGNPSSIGQVVFKSRSSQNRIIYYDQIELLASNNTSAPTVSPSNRPSISPSLSMHPTFHPSAGPSGAPTIKSSDVPSANPSTIPSSNPTLRGSNAPSKVPSVQEEPTSTPSNNPSVAPSIKPSGVTSPGIVVYDDIVSSDWNDFSYSGTYTPFSTETVASGVNSYKAVSSGWGAIYWKHKNDGISVSSLGVSSLSFWIKSSGAFPIRVKIEGKRHDITTTSSWQHHVISLQEFSNPSTIEKLQFQNGSGNQRTFFVDQVQFI